MKYLASTRQSTDLQIFTVDFVLLIFLRIPFIFLLVISFGGSRTANMPIALQEFTKMSKVFIFAINHHYSVLKSCDFYSNQKPPICISNASKNRFKIYMVILVGNSITHTHTSKKL